LEVITIIANNTIINFSSLKIKGKKPMALDKNLDTILDEIRSFLRALILSNMRKENTVRMEAQITELFNKATIKSEPLR